MGFRRGEKYRQNIDDLSAPNNSERKITEKLFGPVEERLARREAARQEIFNCIEPEAQDFRSGETNVYTQITVERANEPLYAEIDRLNAELDRVRARLKELEQIQAVNKKAA